MIYQFLAARIVPVHGEREVSTSVADSIQLETRTGPLYVAYREGEQPPNPPTLRAFFSMCGEVRAGKVAFNRLRDQSQACPGITPFFFFFNRPEKKLSGQTGRGYKNTGTTDQRTRQRERVLEND